MPELNGTMPRDVGPMAPCVWCGADTDLRFVPAGQPHLGPQPLHIACGLALIRAYERWRAGYILDDVTMRRLGKLTHAPALPSA